MSHEQKAPTSESLRASPVEHVGILKDKEKNDLENQIVDTLKSLNSHMTKKEILSLIHRIEVGKGLEGLRMELSKEKKLEDMDISDEALQDILNLFHEVEKVAESGLQELKLELRRLNVSKEYTVDTAIYMSSKFPWIKKIEDSKLGENIIIDLVGIGIGTLDSVYTIAKFLLILLGDLPIFFRDIVMSPKQVLEEARK